MTTSPRGPSNHYFLPAFFEDDFPLEDFPAAVFLLEEVFLLDDFFVADFFAAGTLTPADDCDTRR